MRGWLGCLVLAWGCGGDRIAECEVMLATIEKVAACGRLEAPQRAQVEQAMQSIKDALDRIAAVGPDRAPAALLDEAKRTCAKQDSEIQRLYEKVAPECLR